jgi:hypothetical protein
VVPPREETGLKHEDSRRGRLAPTRVCPAAWPRRPVGHLPGARRTGRPHPRAAIRQNARLISLDSDYRSNGNDPLLPPGGRGGQHRKSTAQAINRPGIRWLSAISVSRNRRPAVSLPCGAARQVRSPRSRTDPGRSLRPACRCPHMRVVTCPSRLPIGRHRNPTERSGRHRGSRKNYFPSRPATRRHPLRPSPAYPGGISIGLVHHHLRRNNSTMNYKGFLTAIG